MHLNTIDFNAVQISSPSPALQYVWQLQTVDGEIFDFIVFTAEEDERYRVLA
jgi:hypothetical protein